MTIARKALEFFGRNTTHLTDDLKRGPFGHCPGRAVWQSPLHLDSVSRDAAKIA